MATKEINSDLSIKNLKLPDKRTELKVKNSPALYLRVSPNGKYWYLRARPAGSRNPVAIKIGAYGNGEQAYTLKQAREKANQLKEDIRGGIDPRIEAQKAKGSLYAEIVAEFLDRAKTAQGEPWKPATKKGYTHTLSRFTQWHNTPVSQISESTVQRAINDLEQQGKYTTARRSLSYLRAFFAWCRRKKQGYIPTSQGLPTDGIELEQQRDQIRERHFSTEEIQIFWLAADQLEYPWKQYYQLALLTGQRMGNVANIKRTDVSGDIWTQKENKANRTTLVPLNDLAITALKSCPDHSEFYLSSNRKNAIHQSSKAKTRLDGLIAAIKTEQGNEAAFKDDWVNHDLRRTLTTELRKMRISRAVCSSILNHAEQGVTAKNYDQYEMLTEKTSALNAWSDYLDEIIGGNNKKVIQLRDDTA